MCMIHINFYNLDMNDKVASTNVFLITLNESSESEITVYSESGTDIYINLVTRYGININ